MKSAKEMFEELGYKAINTQHSIEYIKWKGQKEQSIYFDSATKTLGIYIYDTYDDVYDILTVDMPTLKAINKQCEELGWLDE